MLMLAAAPLAAWTSHGHRLLSAAVLELLPRDYPQPNPEERSVFIEASTQPDIFRPEELVELRQRESAEHYLNLERLGGRTLPATRTEFLRLIARLAGDCEDSLGHGRRFQQVGALPYAVAEGTQRLAVVMAQLRRRPHDPNVRWMAMHYGGLLAHYAQDLLQPLHTTIHHDGRAGADGTSPGTGIHLLVDGLLTGLRPPAPSRATREPQTPFENLFSAVVEEFEASHRLVDRLYALESDLRRMAESGEASAAVEEIAHQRFRAASSFTARLISTAWRSSADVELPPWYE